MPQPGISNIKQAVTTYLDIRGVVNQVLVTLADSTRDGGLNGGGNATKLYPGLVVCKVGGTGTDAGKFTHFDLSEADYQDEQNCGVLMDVIDDISTGDQQAHVAIGGGAIFKRSQLRFYEAVDKSGFNYAEFPVDTI